MKGTKKRAPLSTRQASGVVEEYVLVFWPEEESVSVVKSSAVVTENWTVGDDCNVTISKKKYRGRVVAKGSMAQMADLEASYITEEWTPPAVKKTKAVDQENSKPDKKTSGKKTSEKKAKNGGKKVKKADEDKKKNQKPKGSIITVSDHSVPTVPAGDNPTSNEEIVQSHSSDSSTLSESSPLHLEITVQSLKDTVDSVLIRLDAVESVLREQSKSAVNSMESQNDSLDLTSEFPDSPPPLPPPLEDSTSMLLSDSYEEPYNWQDSYQSSQDQIQYADTAWDISQFELACHEMPHSSQNSPHQLPETNPTTQHPNPLPAKHTGTQQIPSQISPHVQSAVKLGAQRQSSQGQQLVAQRPFSQGQQLGAQRQSSLGQQLRAQRQSSQGQQLRAQRPFSQGQQLGGQRQSDQGQQLSAQRPFSQGQQLSSQHQSTLGQQLGAQRPFSQGQQLGAQHQSSLGQQLGAQHQFSQGQQLGVQHPSPHVQQFGIQCPSSHVHVQQLETQHPSQILPHLPPTTPLSQAPICPAIKSTKKNIAVLSSTEIIRETLSDPDVVVARYGNYRTISKIPTLAQKLANFAYFGESVLKKCTVMGFREYPALPREELGKLKQKIFSLLPQYWSDVAGFESVWGTCTEAIGQLCKRLRSTGQP